MYIEYSRSVRTEERVMRLAVCTVCASLFGTPFATREKHPIVAVTRILTYRGDPNASDIRFPHTSRSRLLQKMHFHSRLSFRSWKRRSRVGIANVCPSARRWFDAREEVRRGVGGKGLRVEENDLSPSGARRFYPGC